MARTLIDGADQILAGSIIRAAINTATTGSALITKVIAGTGITLSSTGVDAGTGDVTVNVSGYLPLAGGTLTGALIGTSVTFSGSVVAASVYTSSFGSSIGYCAMLAAGASNTGYVAFYNAAGTRQGYVGYAAASGLIQLESEGTATGYNVTGNFAVAGGITTLSNATSNWLNYGTVGVAAPAFTTRSVGTKLVLHDSLAGSSGDYAVGIASGTLWNSVPVTGNSFTWYGGTTIAATLSGTGFLSFVSGNIGPSTTYFGSNANYASGWKYVATDFAWYFRSDGLTTDVVSLNVAPSGTAGTTITPVAAFSVNQTGVVSFPNAPAGAGITSLLASPPAIGGTAAAAGTFVALNATSGNVFNAIGRNRLDNGNMEIAQRALPTSGLSGYGIDRWIFSWSNATSGGMSRNNNTGYTSRYQANLSLINVVATGYMQFVQRIEAARSYDLAGQTVTVSWNTAYTISAGTTAFAVSLYYCAALDNWGGTTTLIGTTSFSPTSGGTTYTASFAVPSGAIYGLEVLFTATQSGSTGTLVWLMTSVQLEAGSVATPFERIDTSVNLTRCSYYYTTGLLYEVGYGPTGMYPAAANYVGWMRATPTIVITANYCSNLSGTSTLNYAAGSVFISGIYVTATGAYTINYDFSLTADL